jgi:hypothetical protein
VVARENFGPKVAQIAFSGSAILMILVGLGRKAFGSLQVTNPATLHGTYYTNQTTSALISFALVFTLLRAFANGGSSPPRTWSARRPRTPART